MSDQAVPSLIPQSGHDDLRSRLRANLRARAPELQSALARYGGKREYEHYIWCYYQQSCKLYWLKGNLQAIVDLLQSLLPERKIYNERFLEIVRSGQAWQQDNERWDALSRPLVEAFFHARFFLELAVRCAESSDDELPGAHRWLALLMLFDL